MGIVEVKDLSFSYDGKTPAVDKVSFNIEKGSYTTIVGHNGSGKSTIAKLLIGLLEKSAGAIKICGMELNLDNLYAIRERISVVFQNPDNQFIGASVADDIAFGLENHQVASEKMDEIVCKYAQKVGMIDYLDKEPTRLSGGQKQRVAIAGVLAMNLDVIILDEATSMLDPKGRKEINALVEQLHQDKNLTIISITHDIEEVAKSDQVIVLDQGKIKLSGKPQEVLSQKQQLIDLKLDIPFTYKMVDALRDAGLNIERSLTLEGVADSICQLSTKH